MCSSFSLPALQQEQQIPRNCPGNLNTIIFYKNGYFSLKNPSAYDKRLKFMKSTDLRARRHLLSPVTQIHMASVIPNIYSKTNPALIRQDD